MTICSQCGAESEAADRFCQKCGRRFEVSDADFALADRASASVSPAIGQWASTETQDATHDASAASAGSNGWMASPVSSTWQTSGASVSGSVSGGLTDAPTASSSASAAPVATATVGAVARVLMRSLVSPDPAGVREYVLDGHTIAIGRSPSCDIVVEGDQLISRRHALLRYDGARYLVVDLGSSNGTFVNDEEITEARPLRDGDRVSVGEHELLYSTQPASSSASSTGTHLRDLAPAATPPPKTEPHLAVLSALEAPAQGSAARAGEWPGEGFPGLDPADPTVPRSDGPNDESAMSAPTLADAAAIGGVALGGVALGGVAIGGVAIGGVTADEMPTVTTLPASSGELETIRAQVTQMVSVVETLARRAEEAEHLAEQRRAALGDVRERLTSIVSEQQRVTPAEGDPTDDLTSLVRIARLAADNPRHMDYVTQLADHAGEILTALEARQARQSAPMDLLDSLNALRAWLYRLG
ncbi:MAG: FHA domain-containing protein [Ktedonobacterales bacterium]|nr:FHA domain-containing protein [Ktedonobacterales bacterium]